MKCRQFILPLGHIEADDRALFPWGGGARLLLPVWAYLIEGEAGRTLVDTGCSEQFFRAPASLLGASGAEAFKPASPFEEAGIEAALRRLGLGLGAIDRVVNTHCHFDHAGGNRLFRRQELVMQAAERQAVEDDPAMYPGGREWEVPGNAHQTVEAEWQLEPGVDFLFTPGHSLGHQSMLFATEDGPLLCTVDAAYTRASFDPERLGAAAAPALARRSLERLRAVAAARGARAFFGHDPEDWRDFRIAPDFYTLREA